MTVQDQYTDTIRHTQESWTDLVQSMTDNVSKVFGTQASTFTSIDPNAAIDQIFDFWGKAFELQREVAKQFVGAMVDAGEKFRSQAENLSTAGHEKD